MPAGNKIKWRTSDKETIRREIKSFNAKIDRTLKKHPELVDILPNKISTKSFIENIETRKDYNKAINSLKRIKNKNSFKLIENKNGLIKTNYEKNEIALKVKNLNIQRTNERKKIEAIETTTRGKKTGLTRGEMGSIRINEIKNKKFNFENMKSKKEWDLFVRSVDKQLNSEYDIKKKELFKENYIKGIIREYGTKGNSIVSLVNSFSPDKVTEIYYKEEQADIVFIYAPEEISSKIETLENIWGEVKKEEYINSLKTEYGKDANKLIKEINNLEIDDITRKIFTLGTTPIEGIENLLEYWKK